MSLREVFCIDAQGNLFIEKRKEKHVPLRVFVDDFYNMGEHHEENNNVDDRLDAISLSSVYGFSVRSYPEH